MPGQQGIMANLGDSVWEGGGDGCSWLASPPDQGGKALMKQAIGVGSRATSCVTEG